MKKCPSCEKTFEDSMRFCQTDGTPLVDMAEDAGALAPPSEPLPPVEEAPIDPYKTMVATPGSLEAPADASGDLLQIPVTPDPLKTMFVSEEELRREMAASVEKEEDVFEVPSEPPPAPEPPAFEEPSLSPPSFGDMAPPASPLSPEPPPSPFSMPEENFSEPEADSEGATLISPTSPIPSPFDSPAPSEPYSTPSFAEPEPEQQSPASNPFDSPRSYTPPEYTEPEQPANPFDHQYAPGADSNQQAQMEWAPPPAPDANWQNQQIGQNTPFQPPVTGGQNQTLPIVSLVFGIISVCCWIAPVTGLIALITGFMGMKNANNDPNNYGGKGLAIAGMIVGGIFFLLGVIYYILYIVGIAAGSMGRF